MHPAPSLILFSTLSGLGLGMMAWLGFASSFAAPPYGWHAFWLWAVAFALAVGGLASSTFHLGHPERALLAFTQWRSSWLSREAWVAVATLVVAGLFAIGQIFLAANWWPLGLLLVPLAIATVFCTAMIYAQLRTVPRWNTGLTPTLFVLHALAGGAILTGYYRAAAMLIAALVALQIVVWSRGDRRFAERGTTIESATGLGRIGSVRLFERPHTGSNYLTREMVHVVGRKHRAKLRLVVLACVGVVPVVLLAFGHTGAAIVALLFHLVGLFAARWLFFAEAEHLVGLYYGAHRRVGEPLGA